MTNVVLFPPLPPLPPPPTGPLDPRQYTFYRICGNLLTQLSQQNDAALTSTETVGGFRASAVDIGRLQDLLEDAIRAFDVNDVRNRWEIDLGDWFRRALRSWVQRCKQIELSVEDKGVHVALQTQDDRGYYDYAFDAFPGKKLQL